MKKKHTIRTILIIFTLVLAVYYLIPTFRLSSVETQEKNKIQALASLTGLSSAAIYSDIYRDDIDFIFKVNSLGLPEDTLKKAEEIVKYLREVLNDKLISIRGKAIKQGLDLQGGMHLVLEVDFLEMMNNLARVKDERYNQLIDQIKQASQNADVDFFQALTQVFNEANVPLNTYFGDLRDSESDIIAMLKKESADAIDRTLQILENRVNQFGVSEPSIQRQGSRRIVIELPGVQDPARARGLVGKTALLEFKLLADPDKTQKALSEIDRFMKLDLARKKYGEGAADSLLAQAVTDTAAADTAAAPKESKDQVVDVKELFGEETEVTTKDTSLLVDREMMEEHPFYTLLRNVESEIGVPAQNFSTVNRILHRQELQAILPNDYEFLWSKEAEIAPDGNKYYRLYYLKKEPELTGAYLRDAQVQIGGGGSAGTSAGQPIVAFELDRQGGRIFSRVTGANVNKNLAIVLDEKVHMAPRIKTKIPDGRGIIEGSKDMDEARDLSIVLRAGALPAPVEIIEERTVGPSLGMDSVNKGMLSGIAGLVLVIIFMIMYYRLSGVVANMALLINLVFIMAVLAGFQGTLTLPGIAGIVLTIGMAVDANVLIFERIREESATGKTVKAAIDAGYSRAMVTILDANITTLMSAIVLYQFGTGPIKGFALTLTIGIISSMFTAIVITRAVFDWYTSRFAPQKLSI